MNEEDVLKCLAASTHLGCTNMDLQIEQYIDKREKKLVYIIFLRTSSANIHKYYIK